MIIDETEQNDAEENKMNEINNHDTTHLKRAQEKISRLKRIDSNSLTKTNAEDETEIPESTMSRPPIPQIRKVQKD